jgi:predicted patatin/cPLA2 family phospholipase
MMKIGVVDVGGGLRGIYAAGVFDYCMDENIKFDCCIGVSAGSANVASYLSGQRGRNYKFYTDYAFRNQYMGMGNLLRRGSYIDLDYVYGTLCNSGGESPYDYEAMTKNPAELYIVAQEAVSGKTKYFTKDDIRRDDYRVLMASSCIPGVNRPYDIDGVKYYDGALGDPVPVQKAIDLGCDRVVVILTKPADIIRTHGKDPLFASMLKRKYPVSARHLINRADKYNRSVAVAREYAEKGRALIVAPDNTEGVSTLSRDRQALNRLYKKGYKDGAAIKKWLM